VFPDRYHAEVITSPRQARHALSYVINNFRKHEEDRRAPMSEWQVDWFSSAAMFSGWAEYGDEAFLWRGPADLRSAGGMAAADLAVARRLEEGRHDLVSRGSLGEAVMDEEWTGGADSECGRLVLERGGRRPVTISCHEVPRRKR
jgi:hypothetical protein